MNIPLPPAKLSCHKCQWPVIITEYEFDSTVTVPTSNGGITCHVYKPTHTSQCPMCAEPIEYIVKPIKVNVGFLEFKNDRPR